MRIIARSTLRDFWAQYPDAEQPLKAWFAEVSAATWNSSADVKDHFRSASIINNERVVFNICGNKYRLIVSVNYEVGIVFIKFLGTHEHYDKVDARKVEWKRSS
ncbi:MAG: type II toxin-antitoxin system HigB family toxin [Candidatus Hydrogenedentota bacterium]